MAANGDSMPLGGIGSVDTPSIDLSDVYYIPGLTVNLKSVSKICDSRCDDKFSISDCFIYDWKIQEVVGTCHGLAKFSSLPFNNSVPSSNSLFDLVHYDV
ncbi:hypothetical protein Tco_0633331 [Tanacetum coccineum]